MHVCRKVPGSLHMDCLSLSLSLSQKLTSRKLIGSSHEEEAEREEQSPMTFDLQRCVSLVQCNIHLLMPSGCGSYLNPSKYKAHPKKHNINPSFFLHIQIQLSDLTCEGRLVWSFTSSSRRQCLESLSPLSFVTVFSCLGEKPADYKSG